MAQMGQYILSITAAAIIPAIVNSLLDKKGSASALVQLMGGLFLAFTMIQPIVRFDFSHITSFWEEISEEGASATAAGQTYAENQKAVIIKDNVEAYILDKAQTYEADLEVEVSLDQNQVPSQVTLRGAISPYAKARLQRTIEEDLGIPKEEQQWIG